MRRRVAERTQRPAEATRNSPGRDERPLAREGGAERASADAVSQRRLQAAADGSDRGRELGAYRVMAQNSPQARQLRSFQAMADGAAARRPLRAVSPVGGDGSVAQLLSLNGLVVNQAIPYPNANQANVLTHMAGEWDGGNAHAVTGGHLLNEMVNTWGPAVANSVPNAASPDGVHFAGALPGANIAGHQLTFRLVWTDPGNGQQNISLAKQSTFWPSGWNNGELILTLNNSWRNGTAVQWASQQNMTYWYRWETLGANTLFPIAKVNQPTGTDRQRMKAGRH